MCIRDSSITGGTNNQITGGTGADNITVSATSTNTITGGSSGLDIIAASAGTNTIKGGTGADTINPVSYTHLDVYKRQLLILVVVPIL